MLELQITSVMLALILSNSSHILSPVVQNSFYIIQEVQQHVFKYTYFNYLL